MVDKVNDITISLSCFFFNTHFVEILSLINVWCTSCFIFRAMDFLVELFRNLLEHQDWTMSQACSDSYGKTLKQWHGWLASSSFSVMLWCPFYYLLVLVISLFAIRIYLWCLFLSFQEFRHVQSTELIWKLKLLIFYKNWKLCVPLLDKNPSLSVVLLKRYSGNITSNLSST